MFFYIDIFYTRKGSKKHFLRLCIFTMQKQSIILPKILCKISKEICIIERKIS